MIYIVGVGPGDPDLITIKAKKVIESSDVIAGWESVIRRFENMLNNKLILKLTYSNQIEQLKKAVELAKAGRIVSILNHGDPSVSDWQFIDKIKSLAKENDVKFEIIPGVSSINAILNKEGIDLARSCFVSLHVRGEINLSEIVKLLEIGRIVIVFPKPYPKGPQELARELMNIGLKDKRVIIYEKVTYPDEKRYEYIISSLANETKDFSDLSALIIFP